MRKQASLAFEIQAAIERFFRFKETLILPLPKKG